MSKNKKLTEKEKLGFEALLKSMMNKRMVISSIVLLTFLSLITGIAIAVSYNTQITEQWKELLLLLLGAFIGSYGKIIDYWFTDTDKDKLLVHYMNKLSTIILKFETNSNNQKLIKFLPELNKIKQYLSKTIVLKQGVGVSSYIKSDEIYRIKSKIDQNKDSDEIISDIEDLYKYFKIFDSKINTFHDHLVKLYSSPNSTPKPKIQVKK
jgi:hypothetical protein